MVNAVAQEGTPRLDLILYCLILEIIIFLHKRSHIFFLHWVLQIM